MIKLKFSWHKRKKFREFAKTVCLIAAVILILYLGFNLFVVGRDYVNLSGLHNQLQGQYDFLDENSIKEYNFWNNKYWNMRESYRALLNQVDAYLIEGDHSYRIFGLTGYSANDPEQGTSGTTAIGFMLSKRYMDYIGIVAVDPDVIPLGSVVFVKADWNNDGYQYEKMFIAGDTGGAIIGERLDIFFETKGKAEAFGLQAGLVRWINREDYVTIEETMKD